MKGAVRRVDQRRTHRTSDPWYTRCALRLSVRFIEVDIGGVDAKDLCPRCFPATL